MMKHIYRLNLVSTRNICIVEYTIMGSIHYIKLYFLFKIIKLNFLNYEHD